MHTQNANYVLIAHHSGFRHFFSQRLMNMARAYLALLKEV